jgi:hypothetical protein
MQNIVLHIAKPFEVQFKASFKRFTIIMDELCTTVIVCLLDLNLYSISIFLIKHSRASPPVSFKK